jgi:DnaK suppressor protein
MIVSILQLMGFKKSKPVHSRASQDAEPAHAQANSARRTDVKAKVGSPKVAAKVPAKAPVKASVKASGKAPAKAPVKVIKGKPAGKAAPKKAVPPPKTSKPVLKSSGKPVAKAVAKVIKKVIAKAGVKAGVKAGTKSVTKPVSKPAAKAKPPKMASKASPPALKKTARKVSAKVVPKPATKPATKPVAKVAARAVTKAVTKAAPKAPGKTTQPKSADKAVAKNVIEVSKRKSEPKGSTVASQKALAPVKLVAPAVIATLPAAVAVLAPKAGRPSSRLVQLTVVGMAQSVASTAAKSSYSQTVTLPVIVPSMTMAAKKDPKLANNWKTKPVEQLTDPELLSMPDAEYMNDKQMAVFRLKLSILKQDILNSASDTTEHLREDTVVVPDPADRATIEEEHALELRTRDRERKLLKKIEQSINRIDAGDYGYCDETGEPIGVGRLLARPTATLSLEAQQRRELKQKMFGD